MRARIAAAILFIAVALASATPIRSWDTPWVIASGEAIVREGGLPARDPFSYTAPGPWMNHEWLAELTWAGTYRAGGWIGVGLVEGALVAGAVVVLLFARRRRDERDGAITLGLALPLAALVAAGMRETAEPTAQLFSNVLFAATLRLFCDAEAARPGSMPTRRLALAVIGIQVLWTQLHGGNPTGVALAGAFFLAAPSLPRFGLLAAQALATCAGPYGLRVHTHFFAHREAFAAVREFQPLHVALAAGSGVHFAFVGLVAVAAIALAVRARSGERVRFEAAALSGLLVVTLFHVRLSTETALVALVAIAPLAARVPLRPLLSSAFAIAVFAACLALSARPPGFGLDAARFPVAAVEYLKRERPPGPMWNGYNFGGYLLFAYPEERVFIDGRAFIVYTDEQVRELVALYDDPSRFDALQARWGFRLAVMQRRGRGAALLDRLERGGAWRVSYEDDVATVLVRP